MITTDVKILFIDTNVLIYATNSLSPWHNLALTALHQARNHNIELVVSPQVLREYLAAATRLGLTNQHFPIAQVFDNIEIFLKEFRVISDHASVFLKLVELVKTYATAGKQVHDANIVATMLAHQVTHLLTHNIIDFQRFAGIIQLVSLEELTHIE